MGRWYAACARVGSARRVAAPAASPLSIPSAGMRSTRTRQRDGWATVSLESAAVVGEQPRVEAGIRWALRTLITLHAFEVFLQAVLAGAFLDGHFAMLGLHRENAIGLVVLGYVQILVALAY